jgi:hypothetical protein
MYNENKSKKTNFILVVCTVTCAFYVVYLAECGRITSVVESVLLVVVEGTISD